MTGRAPPGGVAGARWAVASRDVCPWAGCYGTGTVVVVVTGHGPRRLKHKRTSLVPAEGGNTNFPGARPPRRSGTTIGRVVPQSGSVHVTKVHAPSQA